MQKWLQNRLFNWFTKDLYNTIKEENILRQNDKGEWLVFGKEMEKERKALLKSEGESFTKSFLWRVLETELKNEANEIIYKASLTIEDTRFGKAMLKNLEVIRRTLDKISKI